MSTVQSEILLASTSTYRRQLMEAAGYQVRCVSPDYEEKPVDGMEPLDLILHHARGKAGSVFRCHPDAIVVGSDQGLVCGERLMGKPGSVEAAVEQLRTMRGQKAILATGVVAMAHGKVLEYQNRAILRFREDITDEEIERYVRWDMPLDCAGSFKIEAAGSRLFYSIECDDPTAIQGLPMIRLHAMLRKLDPSIDLRYGKPEGQ